MRAHPLFTRIAFEELKIMCDYIGDGYELMKKSSHLFIDSMNKMAESDSLTVGSSTFDVSTRDILLRKIVLHLLLVGLTS